MLNLKIKIKSKKENSVATDWKEYYQNNKEKRKLESKVAYSRNKKKIKIAKKLKWSLLTDKQKDKVKKQRHKYYLANKEKYLIRSAKQHKKSVNLILKLKREVKKLKGEV